MNKPTLHPLFIAELQDVVSVEEQIIAALPKMIEKAQAVELRQALEDHLKETEQQAQRLQDISESLGEDLHGHTCEGMAGIIKEAEHMMKLSSDPVISDLAVIAAAQKVEHYEIGSYGTLAVLADQMGHTQESELIKQTLDEEEMADQKLTAVAEQLYSLIED